jgi:hypothetical protein
MPLGAEFVSTLTNPGIEINQGKFKSGKIDKIKKGGYYKHNLCH